MLVWLKYQKYPFWPAVVRTSPPGGGWRGRCLLLPCIAHACCILGSPFSPKAASPGNLLLCLSFAGLFDLFIIRWGDLCGVFGKSFFVRDTSLDHLLALMWGGSEMLGFQPKAPRCKVSISPLSRPPCPQLLLLKCLGASLSSNLGVWSGTPTWRGMAGVAAPWTQCQGFKGPWWPQSIFFCSVPGLMPGGVLVLGC